MPIEKDFVSLQYEKHTTILYYRKSYGGQIYNQSIEIADKIYLTLVHKEFEGDTTFPELDKGWVKISRKDFEADKKNEYNYSFIEYDRYEF